MENIRKKALKLDFEEVIRFHREAMDKYALAHLRAAADIEFMLHKSIEEQLKNNVKLHKIIGDSFGRTICLAFALGTIEQKTYECLLKFKDIRNRIAHKTDPEIKISDASSLVMFLGKSATEEVESRGTCISEWHQAALDLLVEKVKSDVSA